MGIWCHSNGTNGMVPYAPCRILPPKYPSGKDLTAHPTSPWRGTPIDLIPIQPDPGPLYGWVAHASPGSCARTSLPS